MAPEKGPTHVCKQSRFPHAPHLPALLIVQGPSMSGKSSALQRLLTEVWIGSDGKSCFDRIYIFSPSVGSTFEDGIDETWTPVKRMIETQIVDRSNPRRNAETFFFDDLNAGAMEELAKIIDLQHQMIELSRKKYGRKKEPQICILLDDVSDNPRFSKNPLLTKLYSRGRHANITTVCSVHRSRGILNPVVRSQVTGVLFFKQRNYLELQAFLEEHSAMLPSRDDLERIYRVATAEPYQFLYVDLRASSVNDMFFIGFSQRIRVNIASPEMEADPFSNQTRDPVIGPTKGEYGQPAETTVMKPGTREQRLRFAPRPADATPHQLQKQGTLRTGRPSGL